MADCNKCIHKDICYFKYPTNKVRKQSDDCSHFKEEKQGILDNVKHFLEVEIEITTQRLNSKDQNPFYNGVVVGYLKSVTLLSKHILFCQQLLKLIEKEKGEQTNDSLT